MARSFISQAQLATMLCISLKTLQNRLSERPFSLPLPLRMPGSRPVWDPLVVEAWQNKLLDTYAFDVLPPATLEPTKTLVKRKPGRPSNAERFARGELRNA